MVMQNITLCFFLENCVDVCDWKSSEKLFSSNKNQILCIFLPGLFSTHEEDTYDGYVSVNGGVHEYSFSSKGTLYLGDNLVASTAQACL